jgi:2-polyprenyl-6-methoxyphenol hydroxylase-like FAD-dependent oxidoreductase
VIHDVAIAGGGVAAAAAALALREAGGSCCVVAPPAAEGDRIGETLSPAANPVLRALGVWEAFRQQGHAPARTTFSAWGGAQLVEQNAFASLEGPGWHLDRPRFERWLWSCAASPRTVRRHTAVRRAERRGGCWGLSLADGSELRARFLLDCTGRPAAVARTLTGRRRADRLVAACAFLRHVEPDVEPTAATLIEAQADGWWYSALVPDGRMVVAYFSDPDLLPRRLARDAAAWRLLVARSTWTARRIESAGFALAGPPALVDAGTRWLEAPAGDGWAAAGDAAAAFDPLSSHGITLALWSGHRAALAALAALDGRPEPLADYAASVAGGVRAYREQHARIHALVRRFADRPFWRRRTGPDAAHVSDVAGD